MLSWTLNVWGKNTVACHGYWSSPSDSWESAKLFSGFCHLLGSFCLHVCQAHGEGSNRPSIEPEAYFHHLSHQLWTQKRLRVGNVSSVSKRGKHQDLNDTGVVCLLLELVCALSKLGLSKKIYWFRTVVIAKYFILDLYNTIALLLCNKNVSYTM